jgi:hypothetical protein
MKNKIKLVEQSEELSTETRNMKQSVELGCFSKETYPWFTMDESQPRRTKSGLDVVTGVNNKKETVWFYSNGTVKNMITKNVGIWDCKKEYTTQQQQIINSLVNAGWTDVEPDVTSDAHDTEMDIRLFQNRKYAKYFSSYTPVWYVGVEIAKNNNPNAKQTTTNTTETSQQRGGDNSDDTVSSIADSIRQNATKTSRKDCRAAIKTLFNADKNPGITYFTNDRDIILFKNTAKKCSQQGMNFTKGILGVGDELDYLLNKRGKFGLMESKKINLKGIIKENLIKTQENKNRLLQESNIVKTRLNIILEGKTFKTKKQVDDVYVTILSEMIYLHKQGFNEDIIAENVDSVFGVLGNIFGTGINGVIETFKEKGVNYILEKLGLSSNNFLKNFLITSLANTDIKDVPKLFSDCNFLTKKIAESIPEAYLRKLEYEKGMGNVFMDTVRNSLYDVIKNSDFADKVESKISGIVCPLVQQMTGKFSNHLSGMKSSLISNPLNMQS